MLQIASGDVVVRSSALAPKAKPIIEAVAMTRNLVIHVTLPAIILPYLGNC